MLVESLVVCNTMHFHGVSGRRGSARYTFDISDSEVDDQMKGAECYGPLAYLGDSTTSR